MMKSVNEIVDLASAYYGSAALFAAIDVDLFARIEKGERIEGRGLTLLADACVAEGLLEGLFDIGKVGEEIVDERIVCTPLMRHHDSTSGSGSITHLSECQPP